MTSNPAVVGMMSMAIAALLAASCGSDDGGGSTDADDVQGTEWTLDEVAGEAVPDGVVVTLEFDGERVAGTGGCNQYNSAATFDDGDVTIAPEIVSTRMACEDPASSVEFSYLETLVGASGFEVIDGELQMTDADDEITLRFRSA